MDSARRSMAFTLGLLAVFLAHGAGSASGAQPIFDSGLITPQTPGHAVHFDADITGAERLYLVVADGGDGFGCDWADWAEARLLGPPGEMKLTELEWESARAGWGAVRVDANADGGPLRIAGEPVEYGIGTHANSVIAYDLPEGHGYTRFVGRAGLDQGGTEQGCGSTVRFLVFTEEPDAERLFTDPGEGDAVRDPANAVAALDVHHDELGVALFASEPMITSPSNIDVDHRGRVWVCEVMNYRFFANPHNPEREAGDRILILEDTTGDGKADKKTVFYQGTDIDAALGVTVLGNRVIVARSPHVLVLTDTTGDDKADKKEVLFSGIGGEDHDHGVHAVVVGPDGRLYFNFGDHGGRLRDADGEPIVDLAGNEVNDSGNPYRKGMVFRCEQDGSRVETLGWNFRNPYELAVDSFGTIWQSDNDDDGHRGVRINYVMEFGNYGYTDEMTGAGWRTERTNMEAEDPLRHWHLNDPGVVPNLLQTYAGSPTGITINEGDLLPEVYRNQMIHADAGPNIVRSYPVEKDGAGYSAEIVNILEGARDNWFRPSSVRIAPDGSLIVSDWYDPGVGGHRMGDVERGRIFRVAPKGHEYRVPEFDFDTIEGAIEALKSPNHAVRYLAWTALHERGVDAEPALRELYAHDNPRFRARALWLLGRIDGRGEHYVERAIGDDDPDIRITGIRLARQIEMDVIGVVRELVDDPSPRVRRECAIALRHHDSSEAADLWARLALQHDGEDRWYLEALGIGADRQWDEYLGAWLGRVGDGWDTAAGRDIIWRSRSKRAPALLAEIIQDADEDEQPRYFRALDFHDGPEKEEALRALLGL